MGIMTTLSDLDKINKIGNVRINVALRRLRETIFGAEKQYVLHILSVCLSVTLIIQHAIRMCYLILSSRHRFWPPRHRFFLVSLCL